MKNLKTKYLNIFIRTFTSLFTSFRRVFYQQPICTLVSCKPVEMKLLELQKNKCSRSYSFLYFLSLLTSLLLQPPLAFSADKDMGGKIITVCSDCENKTIAEALNKVLDHDTIRVHPGIYYEHDLLIERSIRIVAEDPFNKPSLDIQGKGNGFIVRANGVAIINFKILNSGFSHTEEFAGIKIETSQNCSIENNDLYHNGFGIYVAKSKSCTFSKNKIIGTGLSEGLTGNGIHIWNSQNMKLEGNTLSKNRDGIYFEFVTDTFIFNNVSTGNVRYGLHFMYSHNNEYRENTFVKNDSGVAVMYSKKIRMFRNRFEKNRGPASYGLLLKDISDSQIAGNIFYDNTLGIFLDDTTRTNFEMNLLKDNGWALRVLGNTDSNNITKNDFVGNMFDLATNASTNLNKIDKNYWDRYAGLDLDQDFIGDDSYHPVQFTSLLISNYPTSILLLDSLFYSFLDKIEKALPILTPEAFKDEKPLMKRATDLNEVL